MSYPQAGPNPDNTLTVRPFFDDGNLPSRGTLVGEPDMATGDHAQAHENAYALAMSIITTVGNGWVPAPVGKLGNQALTWTAGAVTATVTTVSEQAVTASGDVSGWLAPGHKVRVTDSGTPKFFIVTVVSGSNVTLLGPSGQTALSTIDTGSFFFSWNGGIGFPLDPVQWAPLFSRATDDVVSNPVAGTWQATNTPSIHVPAGLWLVEFRACIELSGSNISALGLNAGLSTTGNTDPASTGNAGLKSVATVIETGTGQTLRATVSGEAPRNLTSVGTTTNYSLNTMTGSTGASSLTVKGTLVTTVIRARCLYL